MLTHRRRAGLTLIELVIVMTILIALAGLIIPSLAGIGRQSDMAASAKTQADHASSIQLHFVQLRRMPQGLDSLLVSTAAETTPSAVFLPVDDAVTGEQTTGLPDSGPHLDEQLEVTDLSALFASDSTLNYPRSLKRSGFDFVYDHDATPTVDANESAVFLRTFATTGYTVATVVEDGSSAIARAIFPQSGGVPPTGIKLVAFGLGASSSLVGKMAMNAPIYPGCDGSYYGRYVAIFKVYADGRRVQLAMVVDSYGRFPDYTIKQYNEMLPEGARRG